MTFISTTTILSNLSPLALDVFFLFNKSNRGILTPKKLSRLLDMDGRSSFAILYFLKEHADLNCGIVEGALGRYRIQKIQKKNGYMLKVEKINDNGRMKT